MAAPSFFSEGSRVVCFGDSLTHTGWYPVFLAGALAPRRVRVINAGIAGNDLGTALDRFDEDVAVHHPDRVILFFGLNDVNLFGYHGAPTEETRAALCRFEENLECAAEKIAAAGAAQFWITPPPFDEYGDQNCCNAPGADRFGVTGATEILHRAAQRWSVPLLDVHTPLQRLCREQGVRLSLDRIHPRRSVHLAITAMLLEAAGETGPFPFGEESLFAEAAQIAPAVTRVFFCGGDARTQRLRELESELWRVTELERTLGFVCQYVGGSLHWEYCASPEQETALDRWADSFRQAANAAYYRDAVARFRRAHGDADQLRQRQRELESQLFSL